MRGAPGLLAPGHAAVLPVRRPALRPAVGPGSAGTVGRIGRSDGVSRPAQASAYRASLAAVADDATGVLADDAVDARATSRAQMRREYPGLAPFWRTVDAINELEPRMRGLSDAALRGQTARLRAALARGETLESLLPEAFATAREAARRVLGMRHFDVQLLGGIVLHKGCVAEMATGEGKTLTATLPAYLNALGGKGVHIVTVNNYLASRDAAWMGRLFRFLGLSVGLVTSEREVGPSPDPEHPPEVHMLEQAAAHERETARHRAEFDKDVTYVTNQQLVWDYLRDAMAPGLESVTLRRPFHYAVIDEVDLVLLDEARNPLILSDPEPADTRRYAPAAAAAACLRTAEDQAAERRRMKEAVVPGYGSALDSLVAARRRAAAAGNGPADADAYAAALACDDSFFAAEATATIRLPAGRAVASLRTRLGAGWWREGPAHAPQDPLFASDDAWAPHYECAVRDMSVEVTDAGHRFAAALLARELGLPPGVPVHLWRPNGADGSGDGVPWGKFVIDALKAKALYLRDVHYIVRTDPATGESRAEIVDEFTGRVSPDRRWQDGLHCAVEAKEGLTVRGEAETLTCITFQSFFKLYPRLAGMTGTAMTEQREFAELYSLPVLAVPPHRPRRRMDHPVALCATAAQKESLIESVILSEHATGRPVLVGTASVEESETLAARLDGAGVRYALLNAKPENAANEALLIGQAGRWGAVTIATNMAGRGTDILLGGNPRELARWHLEASPLLPALSSTAAAAAAAASPARRPLATALRGEDPWSDPDASRHLAVAVGWAQRTFSGRLSQAEASAAVDDALEAAAAAIRRAGSVQRGERDDGPGLALGPVESAAACALAYAECLCESQARAVVAAGGLFVLSTCLHASPRIDNQLKGRAARQGDPGEAKTVVSLEDATLKLFGLDFLAPLLTALNATDSSGVPPPLESRLLDFSLGLHRGRLQQFHSAQRQSLAASDAVIDGHRAHFYGWRRRLVRCAAGYGVSSSADYEGIETEMQAGTESESETETGAESGAEAPGAAARRTGLSRVRSRLLRCLHSAADDAVMAVITSSSSRHRPGGWAADAALARGLAEALTRPLAPVAHALGQQNLSLLVAASYAALAAVAEGREPLLPPRPAIANQGLESVNHGREAARSARLAARRRAAAASASAGAGDYSRGEYSPAAAALAEWVGEAWVAAYEGLESVILESLTPESGIPESGIPESLASRLALTPLLDAVDTHWPAHLRSMAHLSSATSLRSFGMLSAADEYMLEAGRQFCATLAAVRRSAVGGAFRRMAEELGAGGGGSRAG